MQDNQNENAWAYFMEKLAQAGTSEKFFELLDAAKNDNVIIPATELKDVCDYLNMMREDADKALQMLNERIARGDLKNIKFSKIESLLLFGKNHCNE